MGIFFQTQNFVLSAEETQTLLQIFIPVSFLITLLTILILVFARRSQMCHKKKKKKDVIIRNNEDIQLLDRMNFVNKNPTYFMTSQEKSDEKKVSIKEIPYERVKIIETVGEGAFGHVYKGQILSISIYAYTTCSIEKTHNIFSISNCTLCLTCRKWLTIIQETINRTVLVVQRLMAFRNNCP